MTSQALGVWQQECRKRLDELFRVHADIGGTGPGRRTGLQQVNWSLVLKLSAEWQTYCRDLYNEVVDAFVREVSATNQAVSDVMEDHLTKNLRLDRGAANRSNLNDDFRRVGLDLVGALKLIKPHYNESRLLRLDELHAARDAIAHNDPAKLSVMGSDGKIWKRHISTWWRALDNLAVDADTVAAEHHAGVFGGIRPW